MFYRPKFTIPCDRRYDSQCHSLSIFCVFVMRRSENSHFLVDCSSKQKIPFLSRIISAFLLMATVIGISMKISIQFCIVASPSTPKLFYDFSWEGHHRDALFRSNLLDPARRTATRGGSDIFGIWRRSPTQRRPQRKQTFECKHIRR
jgi:hypothetical protein